MAFTSCVYFLRLLLARRQVRTRAMRHFRRHANTLAQRGVRVNRLADVQGVCAHLNRQRDLANHVTRVRAHHHHLPVRHGQ